MGRVAATGLAAGRGAMGAGFTLEAAEFARGLAGAARTDAVLGGALGAGLTRVACAMRGAAGAGVTLR